ncbi:hypothetical protein ACGFX8_34890 [Streptomyces sp. NPDC048362]|uniref:hypothetical protein n=1 Tax=Streptomyces sp. NPDC048362 TaxID=3365539 RepID=UPI003720443D
MTQRTARTSKTTPSEPYLLGLPDPEPQPTEGCPRCEALSQRRATARRDADLSKVSDLNVEMRAHQGEGCA